MSIAVFDKLRQLSGGKLTQRQVDAVNVVLQSVPDSVLLAVLGVNMGKIISARGLQFICDFEGYRDYAYDDGVGVMTIGYGTTVYPDGVKVKRGDWITVDVAKRYFANDVETFEQTVNSAVTVPLNQQQFDALVSFTYNVGAGAFKGSTLLKKLNAGDYRGAADQLLLWNKGGGRVMAGLTRRREAERSMFLGK